MIVSDNIEYALFNAADNTIAPFIDENVFEESLIMNILFQDKIIIHEAFFFNCFYLSKHISKTQGFSSLFEQAARSAIIVPAFRNPNTKTLNQAFEDMQTIYGKNYILLKPEIKPVLKRIVSSVDKGIEKAKPFYWPDEKLSGSTLGDSYLKLLKNYLQQDDPPDYLQQNSDRWYFFQRMWDETKEWRYNCLDKATESTKEKGASGIQRVELFNSVGKSIGIKENKNLIELPEILNYNVNHEKKLALEVFFKWITQLYHLNMAKSFGVSVNFPVYNINEDFLFDSILRTKEDKKEKQPRGFSCEVLLPPLNTFILEKPDELLAIRNDLGLAYLDTVKEWYHNPTEENEENVKLLLKEYCEQICKRYQNVEPVNLIASLNTNANVVIDSGVDTAISAISAANPLIGVFLAVTKFGFSFYKYLSNRSQHKAKIKDIELTLPLEN